MIELLQPKPMASNTSSHPSLIDRLELLAWSIQTLMSAAGQAKQQKNPGAVVACIKQLDWMTGLGIIQLLDNESHEGGDSETI